MLCGPFLWVAFYRMARSHVFKINTGVTFVRLCSMRRKEASDDTWCVEQSGSATPRFEIYQIKNNMFDSDKFIEISMCCLWDNAASDYSNKDARQKAWVKVGEPMHRLLHFKYTHNFQRDNFCSHRICLSR